MGVIQNLGFLVWPVLLFKVTYDAAQQLEKLPLVPEQENQANAYARKMLRRTHPALVLFYFSFHWPIRSATRFFRT